LLLDLLLLVFDLGDLLMRCFFVFLLSLVLLLEERAETDEVVLDQDVLLSQFLLTDAASFFLSFKVFLLVFKRLLDLIHESALLQ